MGDASKRQHDRLGRLKDSGKEIEGIESLSDRGEQDRHDPFLSKGAVPSSVPAADLSVHDRGPDGLFCAMVGGR